MCLFRDFNTFLLGQGVGCVCVCVCVCVKIESMFKEINQQLIENNMLNYFMAPLHM